MHRLWLYVGSRDIKMEQLKFGELLIMCIQGYPHVYNKSSKDEIIKDNSWLTTGENLKSDRKLRMFFSDIGTRRQQGYVQFCFIVSAEAEKNNKNICDNKNACL